MLNRKENSTNNQNRQKLNDCGLIYAMDVIRGRWKMLILYKLEQGKLRFTELKNSLPNISERMLILQLKELEKDQLIIRTVYPEIPVRVEYELDQAAHQLIPIWHALELWGNNLKDVHGKVVC